MGRKSEQSKVRIVAHANNLSTEERQFVDDACGKLRIRHSEVTGIAFIDDHRMIALTLSDGTYKVEALPITPNKQRE